jgi:DDE_Tnp_1-associated
LLEALAQVPGPRDPRGVRYDLVPVLAVAVCATLVGALSYAAIAEWADDAGDGQIPLLLAISDNGPQMRSVSTREFPPGVAIAQQFGTRRPPGPNLDRDLFGHVKSEWPHLRRSATYNLLRSAGSVVVTPSLVRKLR